ncbi:MAG: HupE/UreJ family protein [Colwellia sp.]|nr:HupE/UreJ family protein [Colwellia sp.]
MKKTLAFILMIYSASVFSHFTHFEPRIIHLYQDNQDTAILMRMPLPLILLDNNWKGIDSKQNIPYTNKVNTSDYLINQEKIKENLSAFKKHITQGYLIKKNGVVQTYLIESINIFNTDDRKPFNSLKTAERNFSGEITIRPEAIKLFDAGIDIKLRLANTSVVADDISIYSILGDKFKAINRLANIINLHREGDSNSVTTVGILDYSSTHLPTISQQLISGFSDGFEHILIGLDHVLFMLLLFYSASSFLKLLSLATAFTVGHSFSLFLGDNIAITSPMFIPSIELLIALTIACTAIALLLKKAQHLGTTPLLIIGVIHGFGFSFVFNELENEGAQTSISNLLSFNVGIETGQLFIYAMAFAITVLIKNQTILVKKLPYYVSACALVISTYWVVTRSIPLIDYIAT